MYSFFRLNALLRIENKEIIEINKEKVRDNIKGEDNNNTLLEPL